MRQAQLVHQHLELTAVKRQQKRDQRADVQHECQDATHNGQTLACRRPLSANCAESTQYSSGRRSAKIGMRWRTASTCARSIVAVSTISASPPSIRVSPHGSISAEAPKEGVAAGRADAIAGGHKALVLDRTRTQQRTPVGAPRVRPLSGQQQQPCTGQRVVPEQLGETQIVADGKTLSCPTACRRPRLLRPEPGTAPRP